MIIRREHKSVFAVFFTSPWRHDFFRPCRQSANGHNKEAAIAEKKNEIAHAGKQLRRNVRYIALDGTLQAKYSLKLRKQTNKKYMSRLATLYDILERITSLQLPK